MAALPLAMFRVVVEAVMLLLLHRAGAVEVVMLRPLRRAAVAGTIRANPGTVSPEGNDNGIASYSLVDDMLVR